MTLAEEVAQLRAENVALREQLAAALARIAQLERQQRPPPATFAKANTPPRKRNPRRKRKPEHNRARRLEHPTRIVRHTLERCPDCDYRLRGTSLDRRRQVVELPPPQPVAVTEHHVIKRWCPTCARWQTPSLNLRGQVLGQGRMGVRIASLIAYLRTTLRLPVRRIRTYLQTRHALTLSTGEIVRLLHQVRRATHDTVAALKAQARASPVLHADETGWREAGQHGYLWCFSTPGTNGVRYYEYDHSRAGAVVKRLLGGHFAGHLVTDCYGGYTIYPGPQQRCWVHLLRDVHTLKEDHALTSSVLEWTTAVRVLYDDAQTFLHAPEVANPAVREQQYAALVARTQKLGLQYAQAKRHPCQALAKRLLRHQDELFQFVLVAGVSADTNLAERSIRPLVVVRTISGGTPSPAGTTTRLALASLFETWQARGRNSFDECLKLLSQTALPQV